MCKQIWPLCHNKNSYGATKAKQTDINASYYTINAQNQWLRHRWYEFVPLVCSGCLFALRWESAGSPELPTLSYCPKQLLLGLQRSDPLHPKNKNSQVCKIGPLKSNECLSGSSHLGFPGHVSPQTGKFQDSPPVERCLDLGHTTTNGKPQASPCAEEGPKCCLTGSGPFCF